MNELNTIDNNAGFNAVDVFRILLRRLWVIALVISACLACAFYVSKRTIKTWRATAEVICIQRSATAAPTTETAYAAPMVESIETQLAMVQSLAMAQRTVNYLKNEALSHHVSMEDVPEDLEKFQRLITVNNPKDTNLVDVTVEANSPERARKWANAVCQAFVQWKKEVARQNLDNTVDSLESRAGLARARMTAAEEKEASYRVSHGMADVPVQQREALTRYFALKTEADSTSQSLAVLQARAAALQQRLSSRKKVPEVPGEPRPDPIVDRLKSQMNDLQISRSELLTKYTSKYPAIQQLDAKIAIVGKLLEEAVTENNKTRFPAHRANDPLEEEYQKSLVDIRSAEAQNAAVVANRNAASAQLANVPEFGIQYARLAREAELERTLYANVQTALSAAIIDRDQAGGNVEVAQHAILPQLPFRPNLGLDLAFGGIAGVLLALSAVFALEQSDKRVRTVDRVRKLVSGHVIGTLPEFSSREIRALNRGEASMQATAGYGLARANLSLATRDIVHEGLGRGYMMLVTSAVPGEGKSLTCAQLGRSLARSGKSVILVDADLRRPTQNTLFASDEKIGLADVLLGRATLDEALVKSDTERLALLHSGSCDKDPADVVSLPYMQTLINDLCRRADVVLVDTPACSVVADALLIAQCADCIMYVVGAGKVNEEAVRESVAALSAARPKAMTVFVNRVPRVSTRAYRGYYSDSDGIGGNGTGARRNAKVLSAGPAVERN